MKPLQISPETAQKLAKQLNIPLEHLMHMPQHILLQKLAELAKNTPAPSEQANHDSSTDSPKQES
ncbi:YycC family protein [Paenibacillus sp. LMG 31456]|uniref:YycC family protein n=1 Tax=Paenibacillus foliorum TaxID=2654974 RepID=A0A972K2E3_9BACL|nr:YycC family protein [Paenibacillus foliorum]NOU95800.1 YycC family protein [Paenibacillus foliorum]